MTANRSFIPNLAKSKSPNKMATGRMDSEMEMINHWKSQAR